jgi:hypothetical protein
MATFLILCPENTPYVTVNTSAAIGIKLQGLMYERRILKIKKGPVKV